MCTSFFFLRFSLLWWQDAKREIERWDSLSSAHHFSCPFFWIFQSCWKPLAIQTQVDSAGSTKYPCRPNKSLDRPWGIYTPRGAVPPSEMRLLHIDADDSASNCLHCFFPWFSHGGNGGNTCHELHSDNNNYCYCNLYRDQVGSASYVLLEGNLPLWASYNPWWAHGRYKDWIIIKKNVSGGESKSHRGLIVNWGA